MGTHYPDGPLEDDETGAHGAAAPQSPASVIPLHKRAPQSDWQAMLYTDRVFRPKNADHIFIALPQPMKEDIEDMRPHARAIIDKLFEDTSHPRHDLMTAFVRALHRYVPEYRAAAYYSNEQGYPQHMPRVIMALPDGQQIGVGRPDTKHTVKSAVTAADSALTWTYAPHKPPFGIERDATRYYFHVRALDQEFAAAASLAPAARPGQGVEDVLALVLAASEPARRDVFAAVYNRDPALLRGPLAVSDPLDSENMRVRAHRIPHIKIPS